MCNYLSRFDNYSVQMDINMIQPKNETEDLLFSITKNCQTLIEQSHRKAQETLEFKMIQTKETLHLNPPIQIKGNWMVVLTDLEVYNSIFDINTTNNKFEHYTEKFDEFSFEELKDELEKILDYSNIQTFFQKIEKWDHV